ncbi:ATP-binding protein [Microbacterium sp. STN6]|uniref:sensor histidine kinase n=1 Tax=Microbacterium sp. STN6 TaxID=2995588 RepID=UPI0022608DCF|nr:HAMP domain-containing sensor histidine kinase [Microbacterium sp. STN6]MCX7520782.1 ATP-binding protein [Microbacterium sp. STN6]
MSDAAGGDERPGERHADGRAARVLARIRPLRSVSLRTRLVVAVVALLAIVSVFVGVASVLALRSSLMNRLDEQLDGVIGRAQNVVQHDPGSFGGNPSAPIGGLVGARGQPTGTFGALITHGNILIQGYLDPSATTKIVVKDLSRQLLALPVDSTPRTADLGAGLGQYRVVATPLQTGDELVVGLPMRELSTTVSQLVFVIVVVAIAGLAIAAAAATVIVRLALRPLQSMAATAQQVSEMPLERGEVALAVRVPESATDTHTEVGTMGAALNRMLGHIASALSARQASEQKVRRFVADASHELRTPLASIRGYAELTRRGPHELPPDVTRSVSRIESEATRMTTLVEDLLLLARLDEGRDVSRANVDATSLIVDAVSDAHVAGPDHEWKLELPEEPVEVYGDGPRLHQVVANLLANARVHTPAGTTVTASIEVEHRPADAGGAPPTGAAGLVSGPAAVITIADDGPGIDPDLLPNLFERFVRGDSSRSRATGSTGLGLAIVRAVVDAHGGSVEVVSEPGATAFHVRLPLAPPEPPPTAAPAPPPE